MNELNYSDVYLVPRYSSLDSRSEADTTVKFGGYLFDLPVIPSNMKSVINLACYSVYREANLLPIMHRFDLLETGSLVYNGPKNMLKSISIGVNRRSIELLYRFSKADRDIQYITIDVAHGHHAKVEAMLKHIKEAYPNAFVIAGNITTPEAARDLELWGADAIKVGIGGGLACTTRHMTGFHIPMFSAIEACAKSTVLPIIADGGIRYPGDIAKALVAGATMVMVGSMFAACSDSPAATVNGRKVYYGSASFEAKKQNRHVEGILLQLEPSVTIAEKVDEIRQALQSSISYAGGRDLSCFKDVSYVTTISNKHNNE